MIQQRTSQPHPAVTAVSAHFARLGNPCVDDLRPAEVGTSDQRNHARGRDGRWGVPVSTPLRRIRSPCCAHAARGHEAAAPPSAASNSRRPMVTVIRPSHARCVRERYHTTSGQSCRSRRQDAGCFDLSLRLQLHYSRRQLFANTAIAAFTRRLVAVRWRAILMVA